MIGKPRLIGQAINAVTGKDLAYFLLGGAGVAALGVPVDWALKKFAPESGGVFVATPLPRFGFHAGIAVLVGLLVGAVAGIKSGVLTAAGGVVVSGVVEGATVLLGGGSTVLSGLGQHPKVVDKSVREDIERIMSWN